MHNGGIPPPGYKQGVDFLTIPESLHPTVWKRGSVAGGRVGNVRQPTTAAAARGACAPRKENAGGVPEECFQNHTLPFDGDTQSLRYSTRRSSSGARSACTRTLPCRRVRVKTKDCGEWTRNPVPGCCFCDQAALRAQLSLHGLRRAAALLAVSRAPASTPPAATARPA